MTRDSVVHWKVELGYVLLMEHMHVADDVEHRNSGHLTRVDMEYNTCLSGSRLVIENAFSILKGGLRRLQYICVGINVHN